MLGAAQYNGRPSPVLQDRLDHALELYEAGLRRPRSWSPAAARRATASPRRPPATTTSATQGVPDEALLKEVDGTSTWESLAASARFLHRPRDRPTVILVTDGYHAMRVEAIADDLGLDATVSPSRSRLRHRARAEQLLRETVAVSIGRIIGYDRLFRIDDAVND